MALVPPEVLAANTTPWPVKAVSAGSPVCAIDMEDRVRCWSYPVSEAPSGSYIAVSAEAGVGCAIRTDGRLRCWGAPGIDVPSGRFSVVDVAESGACAIRVDGRLACWAPGSTDEDEGEGGELDEGEVEEVPKSARPPDGEFIDVEVADELSCALRADGTVACWGWDLPPQPDTRFVSLGDGCGVTEPGELVCFGRVEWYGEGAIPDLPEGSFVAMSGGRTRGCAIRASGALACWGEGGYDDESGAELALGTPPGTWTSVSVAANSACAIGEDGRAACWDWNDPSLRPAPSARVEVPLFVIEAPIPVRWKGIPLAAPIVDYDVEYTADDLWAVDEAGNDIEPRWIGWLDHTTATSASLEGEPGRRYCVRVRARDAAGIVSEWGWAETGCPAVALDDRALRGTGVWAPVTGDRYIAGTALRTTERGATLTLTREDEFAILIFGTTCAGCGTFVVRRPASECWEDEDEATPPPSCPPWEDEVDLHGGRSDSALVYAGDGGEQGYAGPVEIVVTSSGKPVIIDAVVFPSYMD